MSSSNSKYTVLAAPHRVTNRPFRTSIARFALRPRLQVVPHSLSPFVSCQPVLHESINPENLRDFALLLSVSAFARVITTSAHGSKKRHAMASNSAILCRSMRHKPCRSQFFTDDDRRVSMRSTALRLHRAEARCQRSNTYARLPGACPTARGNGFARVSHLLPIAFAILRTAHYRDA